MAETGMFGPGVDVAVGAGVPLNGSSVGAAVGVSVGVIPAEIVALMDCAVR
jgi:hypothetical protein